MLPKEEGLIINTIVILICLAMILFGWEVSSLAHTLIGK